MNKKGFTLIELILVITLMAIISVLVIPNIMDSLNSSKDEKYKSMVKLVQKNMKYYNEKNEVDLWSADASDGEEIDMCEGSGSGCVIGLAKIKASGSELNLDDCTVNEMKIKKKGDDYKYLTTLNCNGEEYKSEGY